MLFREDIEPACTYCIRGTKLNEEEVTCLKRGVMPCGGHCRSFRYDPLKRIPPRPVSLNTDKFSQNDFSLT